MDDKIFSRFLKGVVIPNKEADTVVKALYFEGVCNFGWPGYGLWSDNGRVSKQSNERTVIKWDSLWEQWAQ